MLLRSIRRSRRKKDDAPTEAVRLLRIYQTTHADMRALLEEQPAPRRAA